MRSLFSLGFAAFVGVAFVLYLVALLVSFVVVSAGNFLSWLTADGLPVTIVAGIAALSFAFTLFFARKRVARNV